MKHLITSLFLIGSLFSVYAQNDSLNTIHVMRDSTPVINNSNPMTNNNTIRSDSTGSVNNSMRSDSTGSVNNSVRSDSMAIMNNTMKSDSTATTSNTRRSDSTGSGNNILNVSSNSTKAQSNLNSSANTSNQTNSSNANTNPGISPAYPTTMSNSRNIQGQPGYASLPILENYVPDAVVSKVKSKYTSVYDITAVKHTADQTQTTYAVRFGDNGVYKTEIVTEDGNTVQ